MGLQNLQVLLRETPTGLPDTAHFSCVTTPLPAVGEGQVLIRNIWLSLDPYMRGQISGRHLSGRVQPGELLLGETLGIVAQSNHSAFQPGDLVRTMGGWQRYCVKRADEISVLPLDVKHAPHMLSILGMPGLTAYAGLIWQAQPQPGDTVVVAAATGTVGSVIVQLAKQLGCRVVGIAGGAEKCHYAITELGADICLDRHQPDLADALVDACPKGINIYFDLVGGPILELASKQLAIGARVILCGLISDYNRVDNTPPVGPSPVYWILARATVYGLVVYDYEQRREEFVQACLPLVNSGKLKIKEHIVYGLANAAAGFIDLLNGNSFGKVLVKIE